MKKTRETLTDEQKKLVVDYVSSLLSNIITDSVDRNAVVDAMEEDILSDIEECANWQHLEEDEWCPADVEIALARVMRERIAN